MTKHEIAMELTMLKLMYGGKKIPVAGDVVFRDVKTKEAITYLAEHLYLIYTVGRVEDDEGITHHFNQGYVLSAKAHEVLEEEAK